MTRLALIGYGAMGRLVEQLAPQHGFEVALRHGGAQCRAGAPLAAAQLRGIEVAIDFSVGAAVADNVERLAPLGIPMVIGTTGWSDQLQRVRETVAAHGAGLVHGANFSVGVQVFYRVVAAAAQLLAADADYDPWLYEIHHRRKRDAPSGTLRELHRVLERAGYARGVDAASNRAGAIPGTHLVGFDSEADTIRLEHQARGRTGFARGALRAARWVLGRRGVFEWSEIWEEVVRAGDRPGAAGAERSPEAAQAGGAAPAEHGGQRLDERPQED
ncbi:MAG: dihydrodipicolinate reductase [Acidobacteria bacterium]|nr:dihydrodipicolinate reductase [Acidobacteriota bacterium]